MSKLRGLRERKKLDTKRGIAEIATRLFMKRGFDAVTVADIAAAANVSRMTVFNYFPRKEDLFFDREDETKQIIRNTLVRRLGLSPAEAMRDLARQLIEKGHPFATFTASSARYWRTVTQSVALSARFREMRDELSKEVSSMLMESIGRSRPEAEAQLFAWLLVASLSVAHAEGLRLHRERQTNSSAQKAFLDIFDRGIGGITAALKGTPYV
jgi:AcrR family transcriptional regulator